MPVKEPPATSPSVESPSKIKSQIVATKVKLDTGEDLEEITRSALLKTELPQVQPVRSQSQKDLKNKRKKSKKNDVKNQPNLEQ